jgi:hypothetical protein
MLCCSVNPIDNLQAIDVLNIVSTDKNATRPKYRKLIGDMELILVVLQKLVLNGGVLQASLNWHFLLDRKLVECHKAFGCSSGEKVISNLVMVFKP